MDAGEFYDQYVDRQTAVGVNDRHRAILGWLRRSGLQPDDRVLEIGSGVATVTCLLVEALGPRGSVVGIDLSPRSIDLARERLASFDNVRLIAGDVLEADIEGPFDVVVLPDVIEHIPLDDHYALFERVANWLSPNGFALLHYPNPHYLEWRHEHEHGNLQIIDQPVHADALLSNTYPHGLHLDFLATYSIWIRECDYVVAVLRPSAGLTFFSHLPERGPSLLARARFKLRTLLRASGGGQ